MGFIKVEFSAKLPFHTYEEDGLIVACCSVLDVVSQGKSINDAKSNLVEAITLFLTSCYERGTLDEVLKQCGFTTAKSRSSSSYSPENMLEVPLPFEIPQERATGCLA